MLDASTAHVIAQGGQAHVFPHAPTLRGDVHIHHGDSRLGTIRAMGSAILRAQRVAYIGADVLDGVYGADTSLRRLQALALARRLGRSVRVMGSSWSETPAAEVAAFLRTHSNIEVFARDPVSQKRMEQDLGRPVRLAADLGFLLVPEARSTAAQRACDWAKAQRSGGRTVMGVNVSGHTVRTLPGKSVAPFSALIARWLDEDPKRSILILPHDVRKGFGGDLTVLADLAQALTPNYQTRMHVPDGVLDAWDIKAIAGQIDLALTGRMHLAIACLGMGTPPVCTVYQGKFEGLMAHFGLSSLTFAPDQLSAAQGPDAQLAAATEHFKTLSDTIKAALPRVTDLSRSNFEGFL